MNVKGSGGRASLGRIIQYALLAVVLFFITRTLARGFATVTWSDLHFAPLNTVGAVISMFLAMVMTAAAYRAQLSGFCAVPPWLEMMGVTWVSRAGKYIPGKFMSIVGAAYLLNKRGISSAIATSAILINTVLGVIIGLMFGVPMMLVEPTRSKIPMAWFWTAVLVASGAVAIHPAVVQRVINMLLRLAKRAPLAVAPRLRHYVMPVVYIVAQWILFGVSLWLLAANVVGVSFADLPLFISASALAVTLGFVALFAPGGVGVREGILLALLTPSMGAGPAAVLTVAWRLLQTGMELLLALVGLAILKHVTPRPGDSVVPV